MWGKISLLTEIGEAMIKYEDFDKYMNKALCLAREAFSEGEIPIGCVIADGNGKIIGQGRNTREHSRLVTGHAEIAAIEEACRALGDWRLNECTAFVTVEPCPMCAGALINARIGTLVFGAREPNTGSAGSVVDLFSENYGVKTVIYAGILEDECRRLTEEFFKKRR